MVEFPPPAAAPGPDATGVRERLFGVAMEHFRRHGYDGVPVARITRDAGVAKGTFFNHFPRKEHVLAEAFHRLVNEGLGEIEATGSSGTEAVLGFVERLGERLGGDRPLADALLPRLATLPAPDADRPREETRIRDWIEVRIRETLPVAVPIEETDPSSLAFLVTAALRATLEEWVRPEGPARPLAELLKERTRYLLRSAGLPAG